MIEDVVNNFDEPIVKLGVHLSTSTSKKVSAIIDNGFNDYECFILYPAGRYRISNHNCSINR